jgi:hypothetical protein
LAVKGELGGVIIKPDSCLLGGGVKVEDHNIINNRGPFLPWGDFSIVGGKSQG